ncbi:MAG TPA: response regulator, partial [Candidatus Polarisedimenticolia bacterium]|nr:response regulator [Candidatus Polarisedimenticolia bacterium]
SMLRSVLLVDDTAFMRSMLREILESTGAYRVIAEASDGISALSLVPELRPDLVVTDLIMPGLDGVEMTRALVDSDPALRVVVAAASDQEGAAMSALAAGACDFILKPYASRDLLRILAGTFPGAFPAQEGAERTVRIALALGPGTPLPRARLEVLRKQCSRLGPVLEASAPSAGSLEMTLRTATTPDAVRGWTRRLPGVSEVVVQAVASPREESAWSGCSFRPAVAGGSLRIKASLLDRLLDLLDQMALEREELQQLLCVPAAGTESGLAPFLGQWDRGIARMRSEILAARLVPFDRIASRLQRSVEESGRGASLRLSGGATRLDLSILEEISGLLERLLPRVVRHCFERSDISSQLGRAEEGEILLTVERGGPQLRLTLRPPLPLEGPVQDILDAEFTHRVDALGGEVSLIPGTGIEGLEILLPAGVGVVRSYLCQAGKRLFAIPVANVERAIDLQAAAIRTSDGGVFWMEEGSEPVPLVRFPRIPWVEADGNSRQGCPGLLYRVGPQRYALALDAVLGETDVVVRPLKDAVTGGQVAGTALMPDGGIAVVPDLPHLARTR